MTTIVVKFHCSFISLTCGRRPVLLMPSDQVTEAVVKFYHCPDNVDVGQGWVTGDVVWYPPIISIGAPSSLIGHHNPVLPPHWLILCTLHPFPECPPHAWVGYWVITQHRLREIVVIAVARSHDSWWWHNTLTDTMDPIHMDIGANRWKPALQEQWDWSDTRRQWRI